MRTLTLALLLFLTPVSSLLAGRSPLRVDKVRTEDGGTVFQLENRKPFPVTITWEFTRLENLATDVALPHTLNLAPSATAEIRVRVIEEGRAGRWKYRYHWNTGPGESAPDTAYPYRLPYAPGSGFSVLQGFDGGFSHTGAERFCVDWSMPEGTLVTAARDGMVMDVEDRYAESGGPELRDKANYVRVLHADGTVGAYLHFEKGGVRVEEGQMVRVGDVLGTSGNTGFSTEPHLHFGVFRVVDGQRQESVPIVFSGTDGAAVTLLRGRTYVR